MHPILTHKSKLGLYLATWLLFAVMLAALTAWSGNLGTQEAFVLLVPMLLLYAFVCLSSWYLCRIFTLENSGLLQLLGVYLSAAGLSTALWLALGEMGAKFLEQWPAFADVGTRYHRTRPLLAGAAFLLFVLTAVLHYLFVAFENTRSVEKKLLQLELLAREAELQNLKAQIHPHFLFNSLHAISALTASNAKAAREMCLRLAEFLRKSLALKAETQISLLEELRLLEHYLALEQVRLGARLQVEKDIAAASASCLVPALLLQPLLENAVNHGIAALVAGGTITLLAQLHRDQLEIVISNPFDPEYRPRRGEGVGLRNVTRRLAAIYGEQAHLLCEKDNEQFRVQLILPARFAATAEAAPLA